MALRTAMHVPGQGQVKVLVLLLGKYYLLILGDDSDCCKADLNNSTCLDNIIAINLVQHFALKEKCRHALFKVFDKLWHLREVNVALKLPQERHGLLHVVTGQAD